MTKVSTVFNNFSRGRLDHNLMGRFDLPIYPKGGDVFENFISNYQGNAIFRNGEEQMVAFQDCGFIEFKFNTQQNYICVFFTGFIQFLAYDSNNNFGWVLNGGGTTLQVAHPYTLAECKALSWTQNADTMYICCPAGRVAPMKLIRVSANSFTLSTYARTADPFDDPVTGVTGYPAQCLFYKGRLYFAAATKKPTTVFGSNAAAYDNFTLSPVTSTSAVIFTIADIAQKIEWLYAGDNSLIAGTGDAIVALNGGGVGIPITAGTIDATITSAEPCNSTYPLKKDGQIFYVGKNGRNMYYFSYDLLTETFLSKDANQLAYEITQGGIGKIRFKRDKDNLIYGINNGGFLTLNFMTGEENIIGWHHHSTYGTVLDIAQITDYLGVPKIFYLVLRNGVYYIEREGTYVEFVQRASFFTGNGLTGTDAIAAKTKDDLAYNRMIGEQLKQCIYLDNAQIIKNLQSNLITFTPTGTDPSSGAVIGTVVDTNSVFNSGLVGRHISYQTATGYEAGRFLITGYTNANTVSVLVLLTPTTNTYTKWYLTFSTISGLTQYNGQTISVITDGGYQADFLVSSGTIDLQEQVTHAIVGYKYRGIIKSFCMGFQTQGINTQALQKAVSRIGVRCVATAGGKVGTDPYKLQRVQERSQKDLNYLPPNLIDGTKFVDLVDDNELDKYFYIVQDEPLPACFTAIMVEGQYAVSS